MRVLTADFAVAATSAAATAAPATSGLTVTQAVAIFVGIPAAIVLLITVVVYASTGGSRRRHAAWNGAPIDQIGGARMEPGTARSATTLPSPASDGQADAAGPAGADPAAASTPPSPRPTEEESA